MSVSYQEMEKLLDKLCRDVNKSRRADQSAIDISEIKDILKDMHDKESEHASSEDKNLRKIDEDLRDIGKEKKQEQRDSRSDERHGELMDYFKKNKQSSKEFKGIEKIAAAAGLTSIAFSGIRKELDLVGKSYESMVMSGSGWSGNMAKMGKTINEAGYKVEDFTKMIVDGSQGVKMAGGPEYLKFAKTTREINEHMGRMGLSISDQISLMSKYADSLRESGEISKIGTVDAANRFRDLITSTEKLSGAFGMTVSQFMDMQNDFRKDAKLVLNSAGMSEDQKRQLSYLMTALSPILGREQAVSAVNSAINVQKGMEPTREFTSLQGTSPELAASLLSTITAHLKPGSEITASEADSLRKDVVDTGNKILGADTSMGSLIADDWMKNAPEPYQPLIDMYQNSSTTDVSTNREEPKTENGAPTNPTDLVKEYQKNEETNQITEAKVEGLLTTTISTFQDSLTEFLKYDTEAQKNIGKTLDLLKENIESLNKIDKDIVSYMQQNHRQIVDAMTITKSLDLATTTLKNLGFGAALIAGGAALSKKGFNVFKGEGQTKSVENKTVNEVKNTTEKTERTIIEEHNRGGKTASNDNIRPSANDNVNTGSKTSSTILEEHNNSSSAPARNGIISRISKNIKNGIIELKDSVVNHTKNVGNRVKAAPVKGLKIPFTSKLGAIGSVVSMYEGYRDYSDVSAQENKKQISVDEARDKKDRIIGGTAGTIVGGAEGAEIGAALGSIIGPIGTVVGGVAGAYIGAKYGKKVGEELGHISHMVGNGVRSVDSFITGKDSIKDTTEKYKNTSIKETTDGRNKIVGIEPKSNDSITDRNGVISQSSISYTDKTPSTIVQDSGQNILQKQDVNTDNKKDNVTGPSQGSSEPNYMDAISEAMKSLKMAIDNFADNSSQGTDTVIQLLSQINNNSYQSNSIMRNNSPYIN